MKAKHIILLLRPEQWIKNMFVFIPLFFDKKLFDVKYLVPSMTSFLAFCLISSSIYCLNDIVDVERDKIHPKKRTRPIASGAITKKEGYSLMLACITLSMAIASMTATALWIIIATYYLMNVAYTFWLKQYAIVDVFTIATGFVLRIFAGSESCEVTPTCWLVLMTYLLALFLAFGKRRDDIVLYEFDGILRRKNTINYNLQFLNMIIGMLATITIVCYILYTVSPEVTERFQSDNVYLTSIFVLAGLIKYIQITVVVKNSGSPTKILIKNHFIKLCIAGWLLTFLMIIYFR